MRLRTGHAKAAPGVSGLRSASHCPRPFSPPLCVGPPDFRTDHAKTAPGVSGLRSASLCPRPFSPPLCVGPPDFRTGHAESVPGVSGLRSASHCPRPFSPPLCVGPPDCRTGRAETGPGVSGLRNAAKMHTPSRLRLVRPHPRLRRRGDTPFAERFSLSSRAIHRFAPPSGNSEEFQKAGLLRQKTIVFVGPRRL